MGEVDGDGSGWSRGGKKKKYKDYNYSKAIS